MGSSTRKKKEKKKDFQKPKLRVGKAKPKASNFTDTSFKSKAIVVNQQSLGSSSAYDHLEQFKHNLSLAANSKSDSQRREALAFLTTQLSSKPAKNPVGTPSVLAKLLPLTSDGSTPVRTQLLKLLRALPAAEVRPHAEKVLMYIRAAMTHLSADIRDDALSLLEWVLDCVAAEAVACPGGWVKTLNSFGVLLGWKPDEAAAPGAGTAAAAASKGWTTASTAALGATKGGHLRARQVQLLAQFIEAGLKPETPVPYNPRAYWDNLYRIPRVPNPFAYLNLFGAPREEDGEMYPDRESRQRAFGKRWYRAMRKGTDAAKREGGAVGRAAAGLDEALKDGMKDSDDVPEL